MNKVYYDGNLVEDYAILDNYELIINGEDNTIIINKLLGEGKVYIWMTCNNCELTIGKNNTFKHDFYISFLSTATNLPYKAKIKIGNNNFFNGSDNRIISPISKKIEIGYGNLFAGNITIWGRNDHIIYDSKKRRINNDRDIYIGNQNWICQNASILPGGVIGNNSVLAYGSLLNKKYNKDNLLIAGIPCKIKRKNINWSISSDINKIDFKNNLKLKEE